MSFSNPAGKLTADERFRRTRAFILAGLATLAIWVALAAPIVGVPATNSMFGVLFAFGLIVLAPKLVYTRVAGVATLLSAGLTTAMIPGMHPGLPNATWLQLVVALLRVVAVCFAIAATVSRKTHVKDERQVWELFVELTKKPSTWALGFLGGVGLLGFDFFIVFFGLPWGPTP